MATFFGNLYYLLFDFDKKPSDFHVSLLLETSNNKTKQKQKTICLD